MPHSNFKQRSYENSTGVGKCSCDQTFDYSSPRDMDLKLRLHHRFCKNPPKGIHKIGIPKKATTFMEHQLGVTNYEKERSSYLICIHMNTYKMEFEGHITAEFKFDITKIF